MAARDIMPFISERGGHNRVIAIRMGGGTTTATEDTSWLEGEVVEIDAAAGDLNASGTGAGGAEDPAGGLHYIAAASSESLINKFQATSGAATHNIMVPVYDLYDGGEFVTRNVYNNSDTNIGPAGDGTMTGVLVGVTCDLWVDDSAAAHDHGLDINGDYFIITRILDANGEDTAVSGGTADKVVFKRAAG